MNLSHDGDYDGTKAIMAALAVKPIVCAYPASMSSFIMYVLFDKGPITSITSGFSSKPGSFDTDFPDAIALTSGLGVNP